MSSQGSEGSEGQQHTDVCSHLHVCACMCALSQSSQMPSCRQDSRVREEAPGTEVNVRWTSLHVWEGEVGVSQRKETLSTGT